MHLDQSMRDATPADAWHTKDKRYASVHQHVVVLCPAAMLAELKPMVTPQKHDR